MRITAESGLSECARADTDCMPGFGIFLLVAGLIILGAIAHVVLASLASAQVVGSRPGIVNGFPWGVVIWIVPLAGPIGWFVYVRLQCFRSAAPGAADSVESRDPHG